MKKVLFVCTGNSCRSVMAESLFKKAVQNRAGEFSVQSAGVSAIDGFPATAETIRVLEKEGIDVSTHKSRRLRQEMVDEADKVFVMERLHRDWILSFSPDAKSKVFLLTQFGAKEGEEEEEDIPDPIRMSDSFYENVLAVIRRCVERVAKKL